MITLLEAQKIIFAQARLFSSEVIPLENAYGRIIRESIVADRDQPDFNKSIIVGDSMSDMQFGKNAGMKTVFISDSKLENELIDFQFKGLAYFAHTLTV